MGHLRIGLAACAGLVSLGTTLQAFEVDGLRSEMSKAEVEEAVRSRAMVLEKEDGEGGPFDPESYLLSGTDSHVQFCKGRLSFYAKRLGRDPDTFLSAKRRLDQAHGVGKERSNTVRMPDLTLSSDEVAWNVEGDLVMVTIDRVSTDPSPYVTAIYKSQRCDPSPGFCRCRP